MPEWLSNPALIVAFLLSALNLWDRIESRIKSAREPTKVLIDRIFGRIETIENALNTEYRTRVMNYDKRFQDHLERIDRIEEGNKIVQKSILALLSHAIDGNNVEQLEKAENDLTQYLVSK